jgi:hypothetical protein
VKGRLVAREALGVAQRDAMLALLALHFEGVAREVFEADLAEKNWILLIESGRRLCGFSTLAFYRTRYRGEAVAVAYSGDTIVERAAWGTAELPRSWIAAVRGLRQQCPGVPLYWLLLTSGFRTYRFLPLFFREFFPRPGPPGPPDAPARLAFLAEERLGARFVEQRGIVRFDRPQRLRGELAEVPEGRRRDPYVAFFLERNPGWREGDELVCLTEIAYSNLTPAGRRLWGPEREAGTA